MSIISQLEKNRGTISSALGKSLAKQFLAGETAILEEAVDLLAHEDKNVRAGAAKIIEQVAMADPNMVVSFLPRLLPTLGASERQTRWMVIHTLGLCASLDTPTALQALPQVQTFIDADSGACLWGATIVYLGYLGATSQPNARTVFPILERALDTIPRQAKNVLESFLRMLDQADGDVRTQIARYADAYIASEKLGIRQMACRIQKELGK